jgi:hypothetical protein
MGVRARVVSEWKKMSKTTEEGSVESDGNVRRGCAGQWSQLRGLRVWEGGWKTYERLSCGRKRAKMLHKGIYRLCFGEAPEADGVVAVAGGEGDAVGCAGEGVDEVGTPPPDFLVS